MSESSLSRMRRAREAGRMERNETDENYLPLSLLSQRKKRNNRVVRKADGTRENSSEDDREGCAAQSESCIRCVVRFIYMESPLTRASKASINKRAKDTPWAMAPFAHESIFKEIDEEPTVTVWHEPHAPAKLAVLVLQLASE